MEAKARKLKEAVRHLCPSFYWRLFAIKKKGGKRVECDIGSVLVLNEQCNSQVSSSCTCTAAADPAPHPFQNPGSTTDQNLCIQ